MLDGSDRVYSAPPRNFQKVKNSKNARLKIQADPCTSKTPCKTKFSKINPQNNPQTTLAVELTTVLVPPLVTFGSIMLLPDVVPAVNAAPLLVEVLESEGVGRAVPPWLAADVEPVTLVGVHVALRFDRVPAAPFSDGVAGDVLDRDGPAVV
jgi:hypothetical protein